MFRTDHEICQLLVLVCAVTIEQLVALVLVLVCAITIPTGSLRRGYEGDLEVFGGDRLELTCILWDSTSMGQHECATLCSALLCSALLCNAMLYAIHAVQCYAMLRYVTFFDALRSGVGVKLDFDQSVGPAYSRSLFARVVDDARGERRDGLHVLIDVALGDLACVHPAHEDRHA